MHEIVPLSRSLGIDFHEIIENGLEQFPRLFSFLQSPRTFIDSLNGMSTGGSIVQKCSRREKGMVQGESLTCLDLMGGGFGYFGSEQG